MNTTADFKDSSKLRETLMPDEKVLWKGRPEAFPLMTAANKGRMITRWVVCAAVFVAFTVFYLLLANSKDGMEASYIVVAIVLLACAYVALVPIIDRNKIIKKCKYYVTDSRAIVIVGDKEGFALSRKGLKVLRVPGEDGCVTLLFGSHIEQPERKRLVGAFVPGKAENSELITGMSFYNIKDDEEINAFFPV